MDILLRHKFLVVLFIVLIAGIGIGIYLLQNPQIFRSKASLSGANWINAFEITDANGKPIVCDTSLEIPICPTTTLTVNFKLKDLSLLTDSNVLGDTTVSENATSNFAPPAPGDPGSSNTAESSTAPSQSSQAGTDTSATPPPAGGTTPTPEVSPTPVASPDQGGIVSSSPSPSASPVSTSASPIGNTQGVTIQINDQNLPTQVGSSLAVVLSNQPDAVKTAAAYDVRVLVTMPGNSLKPYLAKFNYTPSGSSSGGLVATMSAQPVSTGSARVTPRPATASAVNKYDINKDGTVNSVDSGLFLTKWRGKTFAGIDINGDGKVNIFDYSDLKKNFN